MSSSYGCIAFSGSRSLPFSQCRQVVAVCRGLARLSPAVRVGVGCAAGADAAVRHCVPSEQLTVFRVEYPASRWSFAVRSQRLVSWAAASPSSLMFVWPGQPCPSVLVPSATPGRCFSGLGSGSWATAAFSAGVGLHVVVFGLTRETLPEWPGGSWSASPQFGIPAFRWFPAARQQGLFS